MVFLQSFTKEAHEQLKILLTDQNILLFYYIFGVGGCIALLTWRPRV